MTDTSSALLVIVPEAEPAVATHRAVLDTASAKGVPAHITVLYPFLAPEQIDDAVLTAVQEEVSAVPAFDARLTRVAWFDDSVIYLHPEPGRPFRQLTAALWRRFPGCPPYGGAHTDVIPHLTIGHDAPADVLAAAATSVAAHLPITSRITSVRLLAGSDAPASWHTLAAFPLG
jgi:2'-5' RNA ligase